MTEEKIAPLGEEVAPRENEFSGEWEYELLKDVTLKTRGHVIVVPRFFSYDGASIPSLFWRLLYTPFDPVVMTPALVHDWLYANHQVDKGTADLILRDLLAANGVPGWKRGLMYRAVRWFGHVPFDNKRKHLDYLRKLRDKLARTPGVDLSRYVFPPLDP